MGTTRAGLYLRISQDRQGDGAGVERQRSECMARAKSLGWTIVAEYQDNDIGAYTGKRRKGYDALLDAIKSGRIDAVLCWHPDRLTRSTKELEELIDVLDAHRVSVQTVSAGEYDLTTASGRMAARIVGAVARHESEQKAERVRSKAAQLARDGKWNGGSVPFGYRPGPEKGTLVIVPEHAAMLRDAVQRILDGESTYSVVKRWNTQSETPAWSTFKLRSSLTCKSVKGVRTHLGSEYPAAWKPILDAETWSAVVAHFASRASGPRTRRRHWIVGSTFCTRCGNSMHVTMNNETRTLRCRPNMPGMNFCSLSAKLEAVEEYVVERLMTRIEFASTVLSQTRSSEDPRLAEALKRLRSARSRQQDVEEMFMAGKLTCSRFEKMDGRLQAQIESDERFVASLSPSSAQMRSLTIEQVRKHWTTAETDWKQELLRAWVDRIVIRPAAHRGQRNMDGRIEIEWRH